MKAVEIKHCQAGSVLSRPDGSVKLSYSTPELRPSEAGALLQLHGKNVCLSIVPEDVEVEEVVRVETDREQKTPSQRIRSVLFILWKQDGQPGTFDTYYSAKTEKIIEALKAKITQ